MRYFLFSYTQFTETGEANGNLYFAYGEFPPHSILQDSAKDATGDRESNVIINGWCEFNNEEDYNNFIGTPNDLSTPQPEK